MSVAVLEVSDAQRAFAKRRALQGVSLSVAGGEIVALLGPNGAGKTSLMRAITGRLRLESGNVRVAGLDPATDRDARRALGIVPQTIALYPQLSARENLDVFARLMGLKGAGVKRAIELALVRANLTERADDPLTDLSGGMQRRLNIVAGTLHSPALLLLDEPTVGVDLRARESIHALLSELRAAGMAILFSTHDFDQAASIADRAVFMVSGQVLREGSIAGLVQAVFGDAKEVLVTLAKPATAAAETILHGFKLRPTGDESVWSGPLNGGYSELAALEAQLEEAGVHAAEVRLRDPGLDGVYLQLAAEAQAI